MHDLTTIQRMNREAVARSLREDDDPVDTWEQTTEEVREYWRKEADKLNL